MHLVKRRGQLEEFDERKLFRSCYKAALNAHLSKSKAEKIASRVTRKMRVFIRSKRTITSDQIFRMATKILRDQDQDVAFLYETHRDIS